MKISLSTALLFCVLICQPAFSQNETKTINPSSTEPNQIVHISVNIDIGFGQVLLSKQQAGYVLQLPVGGGSAFKPHVSPDTNSLNLQVWLLRADGSAIPQHGAPGLISLGNAGAYTDYLTYTFENVPKQEVAGIVVRAKGKLFCQEIQAE